MTVLLSLFYRPVPLSAVCLKPIKIMDHRSKEAKLSKIGNSVKGFTLVETLVALTILVTIIAAASNASFFSIRGSQFARDQVAAFFLAQEGFEHIRNIRDTNNNEDSGWLDGLENCTPCNVDVFDSNLADSIKTGDGSEVMYLTADGRYVVEPGSSGTVDSGFRRFITVSVPLDGAGDPQDFADVTVTVQWNVEQAEPDAFEVSTRIYNWRGIPDFDFED